MNRNDKGRGTLPASPKVLILGLDGGCFELLDPWIAEGRLPTLRSLIEAGVAGPLRTVFPPTTAPAWASMATGKNPGKHGIFDLTMRDNETLSAFPASSQALHAETLWEIVGRHGRKVIVVGMPVSYPPRPVNGVLVSDFLMPKGTRRITYPSEVLDELEGRFGPFRIHHTEVYTKGNVRRVVAEANAILDYQSRIFRHLLETRPWDLAAFHIFGTDRIQHELWHLLDPTHPDHDPREAEAHAPEVIAFFERVDRCIGEILDTAGSGVNIVLLSDHGFGPIRSYLVFNNWLLSEGFLHLKRSVGSRLKYRLFRLGFTPDFCYRLLMRLGFAHLRHSQGIGTRYRIFEALDRIFLSLRDVDWARTVAYAKGNFGQIYLNVRGREPHGIVEPGRHYEETRERLIEALAAIPHPDREEPLFAEIYRGEEIYTGEQHALAPDILLLPGDMSFKALGSMDFITNRFIQPSYGQSGDHRMDGILVMHGVPFRRGYRIDARIPPRILDITPTILHLMGIPLPDDLDGEVLLDLFTERFRNERQITYAPAHTGGSGGTISPEEEEEVRKNLIRLGYLG